MTDKEIIINGVDVSGCRHLSLEERFNDYEPNPIWKVCRDKNNVIHPMCYNNPDCLYKQLQREKQKNDELRKEIVQLQTGKFNELGRALDREAHCKQALKEIEEIVNEYMDGNELYNRRLNKIFKIINVVKEVTE